MLHLSSLSSVHLSNTWLTIGAFDGVHRGHQEIVKKLIAGAHAEGSHAVVLTFHPHPAKVLGKRNDFFYLTTPDERASLLGEMGVDIVITHPFDTRVAGTSARDFVAEVHSHLGFKQLWVGHDFALGRGREGDIPTLRRLGEEFGYQVYVISPVKDDGDVLSSSKIRALLSEGNVEQAERLLGRPYSIQGEVVPGDGRGRTIGIPTANLKVWEEQKLPGSGVYVCKAGLSGKLLRAVANVGVRPTFDHHTAVPQVEAHLLDFEGDVYGRELRLDFLFRLRDEQRFPNIQALVAQIKQDIQRAQQLLAEKNGEFTI